MSNQKRNALVLIILNFIALSIFMVTMYFFYQLITVDEITMKDLVWLMLGFFVCTNLSLHLSVKDTELRLRNRIGY